MHSYQIFQTPPEGFDRRFQGAGCYLEYQGKILFIKRHNDVYAGGTWCIPGGKCEPQENPLHTVVREVYEEVGFHITPENVQPVGSFYIKRHDEIEYVFHTFRYRLIEEPKVLLALHESTEARWVTLEEAAQLQLIPGGKETLAHYCSCLEW